MSKYRIKFMFDWGSGVCLWSANDAAKEMFQDYPIDTDKLTQLSHKGKRRMLL